MTINLYTEVNHGETPQNVLTESNSGASVLVGAENPIQYLPELDLT